MITAEDIDRLVQGLHFRNPDGARHLNNIGPNRWDTPQVSAYIRKVRDGLVQDHDRRKMAALLIKYAGTQIPSISQEMGLPIPSSEDLANFAKSNGIKSSQPKVSATEVSVVLDGEKQQRLALDFDLGIKDRDEWRERMDEIKATMRGKKSHFIWTVDVGKWHIPAKGFMVKRAMEGLKEEGFDVSDLQPYADSNEPANEKDWFIWTADEVGIRTPKNDELIEEIKQIEGRRWDKQFFRWFFPIWNIENVADTLDGWNMPRLTKALREAPQRVEWEAREEILRKASTAIDLKAFGDFYTYLDTELNQITPDGLDLRPFQKAAVGFIEMTDWRSLIADEMGCGKTIEAIGATLLHDWYTLIVCPASLKLNWVNELQRWAPDRVVALYMPNATIKFRKQMAARGVEVVTKKEEIPDDMDYLVVNYEAVRGDSAKNEKGFYETTMKDFGKKIEDFEFQAVIFDECHKLKNHKTQQAAGCLKIAQQIGKIIAMSGTPITSRPVEFFTTLKLLKHSEFSNWEDYVKRYCDAHHNGYGWQVGGSSNERELNHKLRAVMIRRKKEQVLHDLPDKIKQRVEVEMLNQSEYHKKAKKWVRELEDTEAGHLVLINNLRQEAARQKAHAVAELATDVVESQECAVIFFHHKAIGNYLAKHLEDSKIQFGRIDGDTPMEQRQGLVDRFQDGGLDVLLCSTPAAGQGLTMTRAQTVIFAEREWVPAMEAQAEDRLHRIGQKKVVHALYISALDTVDEVFDAVVEQKAKVLSEVMDGKKWEGSMIPTIMKDILERYQ